MTKEIIAGTMKWGVWGANLSTNEIKDLITGCMEKGVSTFDQADIYGGYSTEAAWGKAWSELSIPRSKIRLISKCGICYPCDHRPEFPLKHYNYQKEYLISCVEKSLKNLHTDYLDLLLLHRPSPLMDPDKIAEAYNYLTDRGMIRSIGVSNFTPSQMELCRRVIPISSNQIEVSLLHLDSMFDGTLDYCMTNNIEVQAWSPLGGGKLFNPSKDFDFVNRRQRLLQVAKKYNWELDEMAYLFLLHHPVGIKPVTGSSVLERIQKAQKCTSVSISDIQWFEILEASQGHKVP